jgi:signal transduction histidine kinase
MDTSVYTSIKLKKWQPEFWGARPPLARISTDFFWRILLLGGIGFTFFYLLVNLWLASYWLNRPFAGFLHQNRVVTESHSPGLPTAEATIRVVAIEEGDIILAVNGRAVESSLALITYSRGQPVGQAMRYTLLNKHGQMVETHLSMTSFTSQRFTQLVILPAFISLVTLTIAAVMVYMRFNLLQVRIFALFCLALVYTLASFPGLISHPVFVLNFSLAFMGKIATPIFLLHFLMLVPEPRPALQRHPWLLPLLYAPLLPAFVHIPVLFVLPETTRNFINLINLYTLLYSLIGVILLLQVGIQAQQKPKKQALILLTGLLLPALLLLLSFMLIPPAMPSMLFSQLLERYGLIAMPMAVTIAVIRYELFGIERINRSPLLYGAAILLIIIVYFLLISLGNRHTLNFDPFDVQDLSLILPLTIGFLFVRLLYRLSYGWLRKRFQEGNEDFNVALRIFSRELLQVKSRRDLEGLISWDMASDFRLRNAELVATDRPTIPFALKFPLAVNNVSLGTLFLGAKINGKDFTEQELTVLEELQKQASWALWSIELDQAIQTTEQLTRLKSKFLTNVTHELRTPLNGIINYIGFVLDDHRISLNAEQVEYLHQALQGAERLLQLINNILDMSKIEAGQMKLQVQSCPLADMVVRIVPLVEEMLIGKPVRFLHRVSTDLPELQGDRLRIRQILLNLLSNAAKFTDKGTILLDIYPEENKIVIKVADTGRGIDEAVLPTIFQHFASPGLRDAGQNSGAGLSLPITKSLVELHRGQISLESQPGEGTTVMVVLPTRQKI